MIFHQGRTSNITFLLSIFHFQDVYPSIPHFISERVAGNNWGFDDEKIRKINPWWGSGRNIFVEEEFRCEGAKKGWSFSFIHGVSLSGKACTPEQN